MVDINNKELAPIVVFAFNRLDVLKNCIESLKSNEEAKDTDLYVFVDGARSHKEGEKELVSAVQEYVKGITGFQSLHYKFAEKNQGLAPSVISGVTQVISQYGKAIVVEDDLFVSTNFLAFMNEGLRKYVNDKKVFSICGYTNRLKNTKGYPYDAYFCTRSSSWGWATWKDRWESVDWELADWNKHKQNIKKFNRWGGSDSWPMLKAWHDGKNSSWAIRFGYAQFMQDGLSLFPIVSKVGNEGFDGRGTHGKSWTRARFDFDSKGEKSFNMPETVSLNKKLYKQAMFYNSLLIRAWSRIMYMIH